MITVRNMGFTYADSEKPALSEISFTLQPGEWVWLCGASGSGKTTLLQSFHPESRPAGKSSGMVYWEGSPLERIPEAIRLESIAILSNRDSLLPIFSSVRETLSMVMENLGWSHQRMQSRLAEVCRYFSLEGLLDRNMETLSGGQQQVVQLAAALMTDPIILILDEPLSMLDPVVQDQWLRLLKKIQQEKNLTLLISGHEKELMTWCDRVIQLKEGKVAFSGPREEAARHFYTQETGRDYVPDIAALALSRDPDTESLPFQVGEGQWLLSHSYDVQPILQRKLPEAVHLEARHLVFAHHQDQYLIRDVSLKMRVGTRLYIFGGNGSGKSTLLRLLAGLITPWEGKIDRPIPRLPYLGQFPAAYFTEATAQGMLDKTFKALSGTHLSLAQEIAGRFNLHKIADQHPLDMSHGEQQRLALFLILSRPSPVYCLDEPTNGLDSYGRRQFIRILKETELAKRTFVFTGHDLDCAPQIADQACFLFDGSLTEPEPMHAFLAHNAFYTTAVKRLFAAHSPEVVLEEQVCWRAR